MEMNEQNIQAFAPLFHALEAEVGKAVVGQKDIVRNVLICMVAGGNVLLEGLPGLGKTQMVKAVAKAFSLAFSRIQFTPDLMPSDVTGTDVLERREDGGGTFAFREGPVFANIVLADEINRATPKTQSALLEAMQEQTVTAGNVTHKLPAPFFVLATQNPLEMEGTYPLPEAQMDRFMCKLNVSAPTMEELLQILELTTGVGGEEPKPVADAAKLLEMRAMARNVPVAQAVAAYAAGLVLRTNPQAAAAPEYVKKYVRYGASPRGAQAFLSAAKVRALLDGRYNVAFEDIDALAAPMLRHRVFLNFDALADGVSPEDVVEQVRLSLQTKANGHG